MTPLKDSWKAFFTVVLNPWAICLTVVTFFLILGSVFSPGNQLGIAVFTIMVSLFSGILGGILAKRWDDLSEERVITARGKSAVRSLQLILVNVGTLDRRVREYLKRQNDSSQTKQQSREVVKTYLEEVIEKCTVLEEEVLSSIENWTDIVPGTADAKKNIGLVTELRREIEQLATELTKTKDKSKTETDRLKEEITSKERELREMQRKLLDQGFGGPITGSYAGISEPFFPGVSYQSAVPSSAFSDDWLPKPIEQPKTED